MKPMSTPPRLRSAAVLAATVFAAPAAATTLEITITNTQAEDGLFLTPLYVALHDGSFDAFDAGSAASAGVELLAEEGMPGTVRDERLAIAPTSQGGVITGPAGFGSEPGQPPVLDPGETASFRIAADTANRYLSFLSMVIPSNDAFIGNDDPFAYEVFDASGAFTGLGPIDITVSDIWDAGTEVNDNMGAAFNAAGGEGTIEDGTISPLADLSILYGQNTAAGTLTGQSFNRALATIEVAAVPVPASIALLGSALAFAGFASYRRRRPT